MLSTLRQELVQGHWRHVLEYSGHDKLWLDCDRGCAILARELIDPKNGLLGQRIEACDHRQVQSGIWVPFQFRNMLFVADKAKPQTGNVVKVLDAVLDVLEVRLNEQVREELFRFEPLPGSIQTMGRDRTEQVVAGGTEYLDEVIDWTQRHFDFPGIAPPRAGSGTEAQLNTV